MSVYIFAKSIEHFNKLYPLFYFCEPFIFVANIEDFSHYDKNTDALGFHEGYEENKAYNKSLVGALLTTIHFDGESNKFITKKFNYLYEHYEQNI